MSTIHATLHIRDPIELASVRSPLEAIDSLRDAATAVVARPLAGVQHRWSMHTIARFSDRRLHDMGFERDWDGAVIPIVREQAH